MAKPPLIEHVLQPPPVAVIHPELPGMGRSNREPDAKLAEAVNLVQALGVAVVQQQVLNVKEPTPKFLLRGGQVEELAANVQTFALQAVFINAQLSPTQHRNLEQALHAKVLDRTGVILEIFAQRAKSKAGRLQVELAQVLYQQSRLVRAWTHLERQRGGLGKTGGPGERQIELDRRLLQDRATQLRKQLHKVMQTGAVQRQRRRDNALPQVALVGYTNAGKSTLFEALTGHAAGSQDQLFATLDPLARQLLLPDGRPCVLLDTVGFIADLPTELVAAFKATLAEVLQADVLLHVHDRSSAEALAQAEDVQTVLAHIGAAELPRLHILNKSDLPYHPQVIQDLTTALSTGVGSAPVASASPSLVPIDSVPIAPVLITDALTGAGVAAVKQAVADVLAQHQQVQHIQLPLAATAARAWLFAHGQVLQEQQEEDQLSLVVRLTPADWGRFQHAFADIFAAQCQQQ